MEPTTAVSSNSRVLRIAYIGFAALLAVLYDLLFWNQKNGLSFIIFVAIYLLGFFVITLSTKQFRQKWSLLLLIPVSILTATVVLYNNDLVTYYVTKVVFLLTAVFSILATLNNPQKYKFSFRHIPLLHSIDLPFVQWGQIYKDLIQWNENKEKNIVRQIAIGLVIGIPLLFLFGALFAGADQIFSNWLQNIFQIDSAPQAIWRAIRTISFTLFIASFLYIIFSTVHILVSKEHKVWKLNSITTSVVLLLVNILFAIFLGFQFAYLFGARDFVMQNGITFADYARQGFFQLAWVIGLASVMILIVCRSFAHHGNKLPVTFLQSLFIFQVGVIAFSALKRMNLYQDTYGYTVLRLYVEWFIYFALVIFGAVLISLWTRATFRRLWHGILLLGTVAFTIIAIINVEGVIAHKNVDRFLNGKGKEIDLGYLNKLSTDVIPVIPVLAEKFFDGSNVSSSDYIQITPRKQAELIHLIMDKAQALAERDNWREWQYSNKDYTTALASLQNTYHEGFNSILDQESRYNYIENHFSSPSTEPCEYYNVYSIYRSQNNSNCQAIQVGNYPTLIYVLETISTTSSQSAHIRIYQKLDTNAGSVMIFDKTFEDTYNQSVNPTGDYVLSSDGIMLKNYDQMYHQKLVLENQQEKYVLTPQRKSEDTISTEELKKYKEEYKPVRKPDFWLDD